MSIIFAANVPTIDILVADLTDHDVFVGSRWIETESRYEHPVSGGVVGELPTWLVTEVHPVTSALGTPRVSYCVTTLEGHQIGEIDQDPADIVTVVGDTDR